MPSGRCGCPAVWSGCGRCGCATPRSGAASGWPTARTWSRGSRAPTCNWEVRHAISQWPAVCSGLRSEARKGRMLPYVIEVDGEFGGQLTIGNVTHGALRSAWIGYWVASVAHRRRGGDRGAGARHGPRVRPGAAASAGGDGAAGERREPGRAGEGGLPRGGPAAALPRCRRRLARSPVGGHHRRGDLRLGDARCWSATATPAGPDRPSAATVRFRTQHAADAFDSAQSPRPGASTLDERGADAVEDAPPARGAPCRWSP